MRILRATKSSGFTLIEILITITLVALVTAIAIPSFTYVFRVSIDDFGRQLGTVNREARDYAILRDMVVRIRFSIADQAYLVEAGPPTILLPSETDLEKMKKEARKEEKKDEKQSSPFQPIKDLTKDWKKIPANIRLVSISSPSVKQPIEEGEESIYYFPKGVAQTLVLHVEDQDKVQRSISFHPINSKVKIVEGFVNEIQ